MFYSGLVLGISNQLWHFAQLSASIHIMGIGIIGAGIDIGIVIFKWYPALFMIILTF